MKTKSRTLPGGDIDAGTQGAKHNEMGAELLDDRPVAVPLRFRGKAVTSYQDAMSLLKMASHIAEGEGLETEAEANDFFVEDDEGFEGSGSSVFTENDEREVLAVQRRVEEENARRKKAALEKAKPKPPPAEPAALVNSQPETPE